MIGYFPQDDDDDWLPDSQDEYGVTNQDQAATNPNLTRTITRIDGSETKDVDMVTNEELTSQHALLDAIEVG